jgi:hypothetical protein
VPFSFHHLGDVRRFMKEELQNDLDNQLLYESPRIIHELIPTYIDFLKQALENYDEAWLGDQILSNNLFKTHEERNTKGKLTSVKVPSNAYKILSEGEFNRYYIRGVCRLSIEQGNPSVIIYRAKVVQNQRLQSPQRIGSVLDAKKLLDDLKSNKVETALGVPSGPNSGLSVKLL